METDVTVDDLKPIDAEVDTRDLQTRGDLQMFRREQRVVRSVGMAYIVEGTGTPRGEMHRWQTHMAEELDPGTGPERCLSLRASSSSRACFRLMHR
jgi:hypothetical protein